MRILQALIVIFSVFVLFKINKRYRQGELSGRSSLLWSIFWLLVVFISLWPRSADFLASRIGIESGRGVDLAVYVSIPFLYYAVFKIVAKLDRLERNQTKIIRHLAIKEEETSKVKEEEDE